MSDPTATLIDLALTEDIGSGDLTSRYFIPADAQARAFITSRQSGVISGLDVAARVFAQVDPKLTIATLIADGSRISDAALLMQIEGSARSILTGERTALNFLQRLSGVASLTAQYVDAIKGTHARILDTRKTTPGFRQLEKKAVVDGGGVNHRMGLYDRVMIKDNHLVAESNQLEIQAAILRFKSEHPEVEVQVEADHLNQVHEFLAMTGIDHILLDNMSLDDLRSAVDARGVRIKPLLEASGGVTLQSILAIAKTGVDFISVGALTHSAPGLDLGLDFVPL